MVKLVISRASGECTATQKRADRALKKKREAPQDRAEFVAKFRTLRVADLLLRLNKEAVDKESAEMAVTKKAAEQGQNIIILTANG